jgi:hypothetical protein
LLHTGNIPPTDVDRVISTPVPVPVPVEVPQKNESESWMLVIAVILKASNFERREDIRKSYVNYYDEVYCPYCEKKGENKPTVRVLFFIAQEDLQLETPSPELHEDRIREEQQKYGDVVYLDHIKENMDDGKTFEVFNWIAKNMVAQYVMKTDHDSYVIIPNLLNRLKEIKTIYSSSDYGFYYGYLIIRKGYRITSAFMAGMGYVMSFDILHYIATAEGIDRVGYEDNTVGNAIHKYKSHLPEKQLVFIGDRIRFHDYPEYKGPVSWELNCKDVVIHQLKSDLDYRTTHAYFSNCCSDDDPEYSEEICQNPPKSKATCDRDKKTGKECVQEMMIKRVDLEPGYLYVDDSKKP